MKTVFDFQDFDKELVTINGNDIEKFYFAGDHIVSSTVLYHGTQDGDAERHLMKYWEAPKTWYVFDNRELRYV